MATPEVYNYKESTQLPLPSPEPIGKQWQGRSVDLIESALADLPKMLLLVADKPWATSLKKSILLLQDPNTPLQKKMELLASRNFQKQLLSLEKKLEKKHSTFAAELKAFEETLASDEMQFSFLQNLGKGQIPVLNQYADGTGSGFENCGYHALKNALVALEGKKEDFTDQQFFLKFFHSHCEPLLNQNLDQKIGKRDATAPLLHQILENIPHASEKLAIFNVAENGKLAIFDERGLEEAHKLYRFATRKGPQMFALVLGNETLGHWSTLIAYKDREGALSFIGCDSMGHDPKMAPKIEEQLQNPALFFKTGLRVYWRGV